MGQGGGIGFWWGENKIWWRGRESLLGENFSRWGGGWGNFWWWGEDSHVISQERGEWCLFLPHTSKFSTSWYYHLGCAYPDKPKVPKIKSLHIFAISPEKNMGDEVVLLAVDKYKSFLQDDTIILGVCNQACPKYLK